MAKVNLTNCYARGARREILHFVIKNTPKMVKFPWIIKRWSNVMNLFLLVKSGQSVPPNKNPTTGLWTNRRPPCDNQRQTGTAFHAKRVVCITQRKKLPPGPRHRPPATPCGHATVATAGGAPGAAAAICRRTAPEFPSLCLENVQPLAFSDSDSHFFLLLERL